MDEIGDRFAKMTEKSKRIRSPAYPAVSVKVALKKAEDFYKIEGRNQAFISVALGHWGYSPTSGNGLKLVAALSSYGLVDASESGKNRKVKLSELALRVLLDKRDSSTEKNQLIQSIALKPKIHQKLWNLWGAALPSTDSMVHHLIFEESFNEKFVKAFVKTYVETIEYSGLRNLEGDLGTTGEGELEQKTEEEIVPEKTKGITGHQITPNAGEYEIARYPVSKNCTIRVIADGNVDRKAIEALVAQLELNLQLGIFDVYSGDTCHPFRLKPAT